VNDYTELLTRIAIALEKIAEDGINRSSSSSGNKSDGPTPCKRCGASIYWVKTFKGKNMPVDASSYTHGDGIFDKQKGHIPHFDTCGKSQPSEEPSSENDEPVPF